VEDDRLHGLEYTRARRRRVPMPAAEAPPVRQRRLVTKSAAGRSALLLAPLVAA
jgi:hypothetical protein